MTRYPRPTYRGSHCRAWELPIVNGATLWCAVSYRGPHWYLTGAAVDDAYPDVTRQQARVMLRAIDSIQTAVGMIRNGHR